MQRLEQGFLSVVMPAYNEGAILEKVIGDFSRILEQFTKREFIIVDDGSTDSTSRILQGAKNKYPYLRVIRNPHNRGHGPSVRDALREAKGDFILCCDSDNQFYAKDFWLLWNKKNKEDADVIIGYRSPRHDLLHRILISRLLWFFVFLFSSASLWDGGSPFRLYTKKALDRILPVIPSRPFFIFPLMNITARKLHLRVRGVTVRHLPRKTGSSYLGNWKIIFVCFKVVKEIIIFKKQLHS